MGIVLLAVISTGEAIQCYTCTSYTHTQCGDPFFNEDTGLPRSGDEFLVTCPADDGKEYFCRKIYQNVRGDERIIRGCGYEKYKTWLEKKSLTTKPFWRNTTPTLPP